MVGARSDTKQIRVREDAKGFVVLDNASLIVPFGDIVGHESAELGREVESWFKDIRVLLRKSYAYFSPRVPVLSSRPRHLFLSLCLSVNFYFAMYKKKQRDDVRGGKGLTNKGLQGSVKRRRSWFTSMKFYTGLTNSGSYIVFDK